MMLLSLAYPLLITAALREVDLKLDWLIVLYFWEINQIYKEQVKNTRLPAEKMQLYSLGLVSPCLDVS